MKAAILLACCGVLLLGCQTKVVELHTYGGVEEPTYPPYCWNQPSGSALWYPCGSETLKLANCVYLMELAMKDVDPYLDSMSLPEVKRETVLKLWDRAKNSCWSDLKNLQPQHYH
mgnify:CR=1 FL=1